MQPEQFNVLPDHCPNPKQPCPSQAFHRHGRVPKAIRDVRVRAVRAERWQCTECRYTFRVYPHGVTRRQQSLRLQALSVHLWVLGLSLGGVADVLPALECALSRSAIAVNLRQAGIEAQSRLRDRLRGKVKVRIVAVDCTHAKLRGQDKVIVQAVDAQTGITLDIDILPGEDEQTIAGYVCQLAELTGCAVLTSDDADTFKSAADAAGLAHQICQRHVVPNSLQLLGEIACQLEALPSDQTGPCGVSVEQALDDIATLEETILARAPGSGRLLEQLQHRYQGAGPPLKGRKATPWYRLRLLTLDVAEDWPRLTLTEHYRDTDGRRLVPATNNVSERAIGLNIKERYRTMRGYKSEVSLRCLPMLTAYLAEHQGTQCLGSLLAA